MREQILLLPAPKPKLSKKERLKRLRAELKKMRTELRNSKEENFGFTIIKTEKRELPYNQIVTSTGKIKGQYLDVKQYKEEMAKDIDSFTQKGNVFDLDTLWETNNFLARQIANKIDLNEYVQKQKYLEEIKLREKRKETEKYSNEKRQKSNDEFFKTFENGKYANSHVTLKLTPSGFKTVHHSTSSSSYQSKKMSMDEKKEKLKNLF